MNDKSGWQPIETGPKNRKILLVIMDRVVIGEWDDDHFARKPRPYWESTTGRLIGKMWSRANQPTHWMPLPTVPKETEK
jgi:hypothetical protein